MSMALISVVVLVIGCIIGFILGRIGAQPGEAFVSRVRDAVTAASVEGLDRGSQQITSLAESELRPVKDAVVELRNQLAESERHRAAASSAVDDLRQANLRITTELASFRGAFSNVKTRGMWGELQLERVLEMSGLERGVMYERGESVKLEGGGRQVPDFTIKLPNDRVLFVDAKTPLPDNAALGSDDPSQRDVAAASFARAVKDHADKLSKKEYWKLDSSSPELVFLFLPAESLFAAALAGAPDILTYCNERKILLTSPTTLLCVLRAVSSAWREEKLSENAKRIQEQGNVLYDRVSTLVRHIQGIGDGLTKAQRAFNDAVSSLESRFLPAATAMHNLAGKNGEFEEFKRVPERTEVRARLMELMGERTASQGASELSGPSSSPPNADKDEQDPPIIQ